MSGAGNIKEDGSDEDRLCQTKSCKKSIRLSGVEVSGTFRRAMRQGKDAIWLIHFEDVGLTLEARIIPES